MSTQQNHRWVRERNGFFQSSSLLLLVHRISPTAADRIRIGWNSWNTFKSAYNQTVIQNTAQSLISSGLAKAGYQYVILDEGWQASSRDSTGRQQANATKFPSGIKGLANYVHRLGLKIGIYRSDTACHCLILYRTPVDISK